MTTHTIVHIIRHLVILLLYIVNVESMPPDYCLHPLNTSDCNVKPTPVVSYYLSGSRCEIEYWRGCPTFNKFDNEYDCSDMCIFRYGRPPVEEVVVEPPSENNLFEELMKIPEENLTIIEDIVKEIDEEVVKIKLNLSPEPDIEETTTTTTTEAPAETTTEAPEEKHEEEHEEETTTEPATEKQEPSNESGLPEEVETP